MIRYVTEHIRIRRCEINHRCKRGYTVSMHRGKLCAYKTRDFARPLMAWEKRKP